MIIVYLNSKDQEAQDAALLAAGVCQAVEQPIPDSDVVETVIVPNENYTVDTIGIIYNTTDPENLVPYDGWFCNLLGDFTDEQLALLPATPKPNHPIRTFAGW